MQAFFGSSSQQHPADKVSEKPKHPLSHRVSRWQQQKHKQRIFLWRYMEMRTGSFLSPPRNATRWPSPRNGARWPSICTAVSGKSSASMKCIQATEHFGSMLLTPQNSTAVSGRSSASVLTLQATEHFDSMLLTLQNSTAVSGRSSASVLTPQGHRSC